MNRRRIVLTPLALLVLLLASGCGGGPSGTGISTAKGNVSNVEETALHAPVHRRERTWLARVGSLVGMASAHAQGELEGIRVTVDGTSSGDVTDVNGRFEIHGHFAGRITLVFARPDDGLEARLGSQVPPGGTLTLSNVDIDAATGEADVEEERLDFHGSISSTDCGREILDVATGAGDGRILYAVNVADASIRREGDAEELSCSDLRGGDSVQVTGTLENGGPVHGESVIIQGSAPPPEPTPTPTPDGGGSPP